MPGNRIHQSDHRSSQRRKSAARGQQKPARSSARQAATVQLVAEETLAENSRGSQTDLLAGPQFLTAQRSSMAAEIAELQGNRFLGQMLSGSGKNTGVVQRQGGPVAHRTVRFGSRGPDVEEAQTKLNSAGTTPPLAVDGIFGPLTMAAAMSFQSSHGLTPDGIIGKKTWAALDQVGPETPEPNTPEPATPEPETPEPTTPGPNPPGPQTPVERWTNEDIIRLMGQTSDTGPLNVLQASRAELRVLSLPEGEYTSLRSLLDRAASDMEWAFLLKAAAAQRSIADITAFADRIRGMSDRWLMRNLMVVDLANDLTPGQADPEERGIMQQYGNSCGPTSMQLIHAQADPIYALELRSSGPIDQAPNNAVSNPETVTNQQLASEQANVLNAHHAAGTGNAPTNRSNPTGGAWVESDMNALASATGVTYTTKIIGTDITMDNAINALKTGLASGAQVPIIVGGASGPRNTSHYVVVLIGSGNRFLVHDVATGETVWRTEAEFRSNTLHLPSLWNFFVAIDVPQLVPPPLPQPPAPSSAP